MNNFPTIKQMENAVLFAMNDNNGKCEYHQDTHTFVAIEYVPYPIRDSGGSIDSVGFKPIEHEITFKEAYNYWRALEDFINDNINPMPAPVTPIAPFYNNNLDNDLPF